MTSFDKYSLYYDAIYADKDYGKECDYLEEILRTYSKNPVRSLCDTGCGSGGYSIPLAQRGYDVTGVDLSESMIERAREKTNGARNPSFQVMDLREMELEGKFDAIISMFAVIGYITENRDLKKVFRNVYDRLEPEGLYIFDVWNGLAVMRELPENRIKEVETDDHRIIRFATPVLKPDRHICEVNYRILLTDKKGGSLEEINERHVMRFFFPQELIYYLEDAGFEMLKLCPFMDLKGTVNERTWNISVISRKR